MCKQNAASMGMEEHIKHRGPGLRTPAERTGYFTFSLLVGHNADAPLNLVNKAEADAFKLSPFAKKLVDGLADHEVVTLSGIGVGIQQESLSFADARVISKASTRAIVRITAGGKLVFERTLGECLFGGPMPDLANDSAAVNVLKLPPLPTEIPALGGAFHMSKNDKLEATLEWPGATIGAVGATVILIVTVKGVESSGR